TPTKPGYYQELDGGLTLRQAKVEDREALAEFHTTHLSDPDPPHDAERLRAALLDVMSGEHPTIDVGDFTLVEDNANGTIVSSMALLSLTATYEGIPFNFGQPEFVSTDPAFRRRGLVRTQFDLVHKWSAAREELVQGIVGIPWYYRQFGYEMAMNLDGYRAGSKTRVPRLEPGQEEKFRFRQATVDDVPFVMAMYQQAMARSLMANMQTEALWRYDIAGRSEQSSSRKVIQVVEAIEQPGSPVGLLVHHWDLRKSGLGIRLIEVRDGIPYLAITPAVMRYLTSAGEEYARRDRESLETIAFILGEHHPVYDTVAERLPRVGKPYAWYLRVPDLVAFMRHISPALETRLSESAQAGFTGDLKMSFYRFGLLFKFETGRLHVEAWQPNDLFDGDVAFPDLTFLQLVFGFRSLDELRHAFPDCRSRSDEALALLPILFPKKDSNVWSSG
ncbi:MAG: GNAT family N-acetyltransferase, partial [Chloroflexota bacterium]|nr:GNAT family N-acetyltransferase [Chloroflexota bacterium]